MVVDPRSTRSTADQQMMRRVVNSNSVNLYELHTTVEKLASKVDEGREGEKNRGEEDGGKEDGGKEARGKQAGGKKRKRKDRNNLWKDY